MGVVRGRGYGALRNRVGRGSNTGQGGVATASLVKQNKYKDKTTDRPVLGQGQGAAKKKEEGRGPWGRDAEQGEVAKAYLVYVGGPSLQRDGSIRGCQGVGGQGGGIAP